MASIKFDSTEICNSTYIPRYVKHESAPLRELSLMELAREGGAILVSEKYGVKHIIISGKLTAASRSALDTAIDSFKELFSRKEKNLDIEYEGSGNTRRYVATCIRHDFDRDYYHDLFVPWSAEFIVAKGIGEGTSETTLVSGQSFQAVNYVSTFTFLGSARPKPRIRLKVDDSPPIVKGISIENTDNNERMVITEASPSSNKYFEFDCRLKTAKYDGTETAFHGVFPSFDIGSNNYEIKCGKILNQEFSGETTGGYLIYGGNYAAQSFMVPADDDTFQALELHLGKTLTPGCDVRVRIETDNAGEPSGTCIKDSLGNDVDADIAEASVGSDDWVELVFSDIFSLSANTRYWIVVNAKADGGDASNYYTWNFNDSTGAIYKNGNASRSADSGANWTDHTDKDMKFKLYFGGAENASENYTFDVYYYKQFL